MLATQDPGMILILVLVMNVAIIILVLVIWCNMAGIQVKDPYYKIIKSLLKE